MRTLVKEIIHWAEQTVKFNETSTDVRQKDLIGTAVAVAIGYRLEIPSSAVESPKQYFTDHAEVVAEKVLSEVNEFVPLSFDRVMEMISNIWLTRYQVVHMPVSMAASGAVCHAIEYSNSGLSPIQKDALKALYSNRGSVILTSIKSAMDVKFGVDGNNEEHVESESTD